MPNIAEAVERFEKAVRRDERFAAVPLFAIDGPIWAETDARITKELAESRAALADAMQPTPSDSVPVLCDPGATYQPRDLTNWWRPPTEGNP